MLKYVLKKYTKDPVTEFFLKIGFGKAEEYLYESELSGKLSLIS